jgi:hypothetical protein
MNTLLPLRAKATIALLLFSNLFIAAQEAAKIDPSIQNQSPPPEKKWHETINLRGDVQMRYNRLLETNPKLKCEQFDYWRGCYQKIERRKMGLLQLFVIG